MKRPSLQSGFTVLELIVSIAVTAILVGMLSQATGASKKLSSTSLNLGRAQEAASQAVLTIASDLRWAQPDTMLITQENGSDRVDFLVAEDYDGTQTVWSTPISYVYQPIAFDANGNGLPDEGRIVRLQDGNQRVVCRNVELGGLALERNEDSTTVQIAVFSMTSDKQLLKGNAKTSVTLVNGDTQ